VPRVIELYLLQLGDEQRRGGVAVHHDTVGRLSALCDGLDHAHFRQLAGDARGDDIYRLPVVDRRHQRRAEVGQELLFGLRRAQVVLQALALADVAHQALPSPVGEDLRADLDRYAAAVFSAQRPLADIGVTPQQLVALPRQPRDVLGREQIDDRRGEDLVARVAEHATAGGVDVGVPPRQVGHEHRVGRVFDQGPRGRAARFERRVDAVQGHGHAQQHEQTHHRRRGRQHRERDRQHLAAHVAQREHDRGADEDGQQDRGKHQAPELHAARTGRRRDAHHSRHRALEQQAHRHHEQAHRCRQRGADERRARQTMPQLRAKHESQQGRQGDEPAGQHQPLRRARARAAAEIEQDDGGRQTRERQRGRGRRPARVSDGLGAANEHPIETQVHIQRVLRGGGEREREHRDRGQQRQRLVHGAWTLASAQHAGRSEQQQRQPRVRRHRLLAGQHRGEKTGPGDRVQQPDGSDQPACQTQPSPHAGRAPRRRRRLRCRHHSLALTLRPTSGEAIRRCCNSDLVASQLRCDEPLGCCNSDLVASQLRRTTGPGLAPSGWPSAPG
jgi:hypothetical protein